MSASELSQKLDQAYKNLSELQQRVQETAANAHHNVTLRLEIALRKLLQVVQQVHESYTDEGGLSDFQRGLLHQMKAGFDEVENCANVCGKELGNLHEKVETLQNSIITTLSNETQNLLRATQQKIDAADKETSRLIAAMESGQRRYEEQQRLVLENQALVDNPMTDVAIVITSPFMWLGGQISGSNTDFNKGMDLLRTMRAELEKIRVDNLGIRRRADEASRRLQDLYDEQQRSHQLRSELEHLTPYAANLVNKANRFKAAVIHIKSKATDLRREASEVEASAAVTSTRSYTKVDLAQGVLNIVEEAIFDFVVKDEVEEILSEMGQMWKVDGVVQMPSRIQKKFDGIQAKVTQLREGSQEDEWRHAIQDTQ